MAEQLTLLDINLNIGGAVNDLKALNDESARLAKQQDELKAQLKGVNAAIAANAKAYAEGEKSEQDYNSAAESLYKSQSDIKTILGSVNTALSQNNAAVKANTAIITAQTNNVDAMRAKLALVSKQWSKLTEDEINNTDAGKKLSAQKLQLTNDLKRLESQTGDTRRNVGNYTESILQAANSTKNASGALGGMAQGMAGSISGIKAFNMALSANPILLLVTAVMGLINWIDKLSTRTSKGANEMSQAFAGIGAIVNRILDTASTLFSGVAKIIGGVINLAIKAGNALGLVSNETMNAADAAARLKKEERDLYNLESEYIVEIQRKKTAMEAARLAAADQTKSEKERKQAAQDAMKYLKEASAMEEELALKKYEQIKATNELSESTDEDMRKQAEALANLERVRTDAATRQKELVSQITGFEKNENSKRVEAQKNRIAEAERLEAEAAKREEEQTKRRFDNLRKNINEQITAIELDARKRMLDGGDTFEARINTARAIADKRIDILQSEKEQGIISEQEYQNRLNEIIISEEEKRREIRAEMDQREKDTRAANIENEKNLRQLDIENEFDLKRMELDERERMEIESAEKIGADINLIRQKYAKLNEQVAKAEYKAQLALSADLAGQLAGLLGEETVAGKMAATSQAIINTYLGATKAIAQGGIFGVAQAAIVIATGLAQVAKIQSVSTEVKEPTTPRPKYAKGGKMTLFGGNRHSEGGTILTGSDGSRLEVERGESAFVLNRSATAAISALSAVNESYGGVRFSANSGFTRFAEKGGQLAGGNFVIEAVSLDDATIEKLAAKIAQSNENLPNPIVYVSDIDNVNQNKDRIVKISGY